MVALEVDMVATWQQRTWALWGAGSVLRYRTAPAGTRELVIRCAEAVWVGCGAADVEDGKLSKEQAEAVAIAAWALAAV